ncbi:MAG: hypothetical protein HWD82_00550 [Flavobacteriaceae bacterium]|nr:hypothetical protein [Flavobacteriaceae bacterium]
MQKDIKEMMKGYKGENVKLSKLHATKFQQLLQEELHKQKSKPNTFRWLSIAASIVLLLSIGIQFYPLKENPLDNKVLSTSKQITLGNISPEFNTIETYYTNSINLEISQLELNDENKEMVDGYLLKIAELTKEYKSLTKELNIKGVNDDTIDALISNLQLRLQLLQRLKKQLKQLKNLNTKQNEIQII